MNRSNEEVYNAWLAYVKKKKLHDAKDSDSSDDDSSDETES